MLKTSDLLDSLRSNYAGRWTPALPEAPCFKVRLRDAWEVLKGNAQAIVDPSWEYNYLTGGEKNIPPLDLSKL